MFPVSLQFQHSRYNRQITRTSSKGFSRVEALELRVHLAAHTGGMDYPTIQLAVDAALPFATVTVDPGVYNESVHVWKPLTIDGAQAGADARTRSGAPASETIVQGPLGETAFNIEADDVTIDGFTVQNATNPNLFGAGIYILPAFSGTRILDNIVQDNIIGLFVSNHSATDPARVEHNLFRDNTQPGPSSGTDIYADEFTAGPGATNIIIQSNLFTNTTYQEDTWGIGISNTAPAPFTNIQVLDNTFFNGGRGMYFFGTASSTVHHNNIIGANHYGIGLFGSDDSISIECNNILRNRDGIYVENDTGVPNSNVTVHLNNIVGNTHAGLYLSNQGVAPLAYAGTLDATYNWWGSSSGPTNPANPWGRGDRVIVDPGAGAVDFTPWLRSPSTCAPGGQQGHDDDDDHHNGHGEECEGRRERKDHEDVYNAHHHDGDHDD